MHDKSDNEREKASEFVAEMNKPLGLMLEAYKHLLKGPCWEGSEMCHYTNLHGLIGIVENSELWLSDHRFVNDPQEYVFGKEMAFRILNEQLSCENDKRLTKLLYNTAKRLEEKTNEVFYIACFSKTADSLDQWKAYGNSIDSVCLVFDNDINKGREANLTDIPGVVPVEVFYDKDLQERSLTNTLQLFRTGFMEAKTDFEVLGHWVKSEWINTLSFIIEKHFIQFKDDAYRTEQEIRLVLSGVLVKNKSTIRHRAGNGRIIPYLTTNYLRKQKAEFLPVKQVIIGPRCIDDTLVTGIRTLLDNKGYQNVPVTRSKVQFRG